MNYCIQLVQQGCGLRSDAFTGSPQHLFEVLDSSLSDDKISAEDLVIVIHEFEDIHEEAVFSKKPIVRVSTFLDLMKSEMEIVNHG